MAKRKKPQHPPPLNMSDNMADMTAQAAGCMSMIPEPLLGVFTVLTPVGHYDFVVDEAMANEMVQALRELLRGDSVGLIDDEKPPRK